jgi:hypothetical protein
VHIYIYIYIYELLFERQRDVRYCYVFWSVVHILFVILAFSRLLFPEPYNTMITIKIASYEYTLCAVTQKGNKTIRGMLKNMLVCMFMLSPYMDSFGREMFFNSKVDKDFKIPTVRKIGIRPLYDYIFIIPLYDKVIIIFVGGVVLLVSNPLSSQC